ncbi:hypothetical protein TNCT1_54930 [Streptomyces sp. 1-11]|nr:hypothetical protein TNCT1_54930 [Streptomyces sp. 1-11]
MTPISSVPSTSAQIAARARSSAVRGATRPAATARSGAGRARRSILFCGVSGIRSSTTRAEGTMWAGSTAATAARRAAGSRGRAGAVVADVPRSAEAWAPVGAAEAAGAVAGGCWDGVT